MMFDVNMTIDSSWSWRPCGSHPFFPFRMFQVQVPTRTRYSD